MCIFAVVYFLFILFLRIELCDVYSRYIHGEIVCFFSFHLLVAIIAQMYKCSVILVHAGNCFPIIFGK